MHVGSDKVSLATLPDLQGHAAQVRLHLTACHVFSSKSRMQALKRSAPEVSSMHCLVQLVLMASSQDEVMLGS